jgi:predicted metal-dependent RNase
MRITLLDSAAKVGAGSILIEISGRRVLVDAGILPSSKARWGLGGGQLSPLNLL